MHKRMWAAYAYGRFNRETEPLARSIGNHMGPPNKNGGGPDRGEETKRVPRFTYFGPHPEEPGL